MSRPGCCADGTCAPSTCMALPAGATCGDCAHFPRCSALFGAVAGDGSCDWFPRRYVPAHRPPAPRPAPRGVWPRVVAGLRRLRCAATGHVWRWAGTANVRLRLYPVAGPRICARCGARRET